MVLLLYYRFSEPRDQVYCTSWEPCTVPQSTEETPPRRGTWWAWGWGPVHCGCPSQPRPGESGKTLIAQVLNLNIRITWKTLKSQCSAFQSNEIRIWREGESRQQELKKKLSDLSGTAVLDCSCSVGGPWSSSVHTFWEWVRHAETRALLQTLRIIICTLMSFPGAMYELLWGMSYPHWILKA